MKLNKGYILRKGNSDDEEEVQIGFQTQQIHLPYFESTQTSRCIKAYLDEGIKEAKYYRNWIQSVESLSEGDLVYLSVNSYGGYLDGAIAIINAMRSTDANVHVCIDGVAASAASLIALAAPSVSVSEYASMMIHAATFGAFGKQSDVISHASFVDKQVKGLMQDIYKDFLTEDEFKEVIVGREIWLDSSDIVQRLERRNEIQQKRSAEAQIELQSAIEDTEQEEKPKATRRRKTEN